ncbi:membrane-associated guanylate kinase, WW and PDZ domain-containing protein 2-like [Equus quagga]|uniref:membrane-associated guanylate kinase, WW and PDZ domain-containing protein 2-like n=1 Tax=Equus quagga TaxID=89248 RepID=UPI001EE241DA|nr:membrane-associated guanylate kinase, WW and PDZ domain-containing protein 2-like [Equus quagga]
MADLLTYAKPHLQGPKRRDGLGLGLALTSPVRGPGTGWVESAGTQRPGAAAALSAVRAGAGAGDPGAVALRPAASPARRGRGAGAANAVLPPADDPGARSPAAAAGPALPQVGAAPDDGLSPPSPPAARPQTSPGPAGDSKREHDARKPKQRAAGGQKKQRLGEQRERSASPQRAARPRLEEAPGPEACERRPKPRGSAERGPCSVPAQTQTDPEAPGPVRGFGSYGRTKITLTSSQRDSAV